MVDVRVWVRRILFVSLLILFPVAISYLIVRTTGVTWSWFFSNAAPGVGAWVSVVLLVYYGLLLRNTRAQANAAQASYAPDLNVGITNQTERGLLSRPELELSVVNRGEGVAKNITIAVEIPSQSLKYQASINQSLRPGQKFRNEGLHEQQTNSFSLEPTFYYKNDGQTYRGELFHLYSEEILEYGEYYTVHCEVMWTDILEERHYRWRGAERINMPEGANIEPSSGPTQVALGGTLTVLPEELTARIRFRVKQRLQKLLRGAKERIYGASMEESEHRVYKENLDLQPVSEDE